MPDSLEANLKLPVRRIGLVMLGLLGDVLARTPTVRELRKIFPKAHIECFVDPIGYEVLQNSPDIDSFKVINRSKKSRWLYIKNKISIYYYLIAQRYDLFIDFYGNSSSKLMVKLAHASKEVMVAGGRIYAKGLSPRVDCLPIKNEHHLSNSALGVLRYFWSEQVSLDTRPVIDLQSKAMAPEERQYIDGLIRKHGEFFVISPGSGDIKKMIPPRVCGAIAHFVLKHRGLVPFILYNPGKRDIQTEVTNFLQDSGLCFEKLARLSVPAVAYLTKRSNFMVVSDSGILHLTVAVGRPFLAIFTHTPPEVVIPQEGLYEVCFRKSSPPVPFVTPGLFYGDPLITEAEILQRLASLLDKLEK
jgi:ADP-heptose:LPS heptosyltransferase